MVRLEPHHFLCIIMPVVAGVAYAIRHGYDASSMTKKGTAKWKHYLAARKPARVYNISYSENSGSIFDALKTYLLLSPQVSLWIQDIGRHVHNGSCATAVLISRHRVSRKLG